MLNRAKDGVCVCVCRDKGVEGGGGGGIGRDQRGWDGVAGGARVHL